MSYLFPSSRHPHQGSGERRRSLLAGAVIAVAIGGLGILYLSRSKDAPTRDLETSKPRSPDREGHGVQPEGPPRDPAADPHVGSGGPSAPHRYLAPTSRAHAEALVLAAARRGDSQLLHELADDPDVKKYLDVASFHRIVLDEGVRRHEEILRTGGREKPSLTTAELLDKFVKASDSTVVAKDLKMSVFEPADVARLEECYRGADDRTRAIILRIAQEAGGAGIDQFLMGIAMRESSMSERLQALKALRARIPSDGMLDTLEQAFQTDADPSFRGAVVGAFSANTSDRARQFVLQHLSDPTPEVRAAAVAAVRLSDDARGQILSSAQTDGSALVREGALTRIAREFDSSVAVQALLRATLTDSSGDVRFRAVSELAALRPATAAEIEPIVTALQTRLPNEPESHVIDELRRAIERLDHLRAVRAEDKR